MLDKKHELIQKLAREFAENELAPLAVEVDKTGAYPKSLLEKIARYQFGAITIPKEYGGVGGDFLSAALVLEEFCRKDISSASLVLGNSLAGAPFVKFGTEAQKNKYLRAVAEGKAICSFALTEPDAGSDVASISTTAEKDGDSYILNGRKCFITMAPLCDFAVIFAKTEPKLKHRGITAFIVERSMKGFSVGKTEEKMGMHGSATSDIILEDVRVPAENILGTVNKGFGVAMGTLNAGRIAVSAQSLGAAQGALDEGVAYAKQRVQFGRPLAKFQNTQFVLADIATKVEAGRALLYSVAAQFDAGADVTVAAAMAKLYLSQTACEAADKALQIHGGYGYMREYAIERIFRDTRLLPIYDGTSEIQKQVIAGALLKK